VEPHEVAGEEDHEDAEDGAGCPQEDKWEDEVLAAEHAQLGEHNPLFWSDGGGVEIVFDFYQISCPRFQSSVHLPIEFKEVGKRFHLVPDHQMGIRHIRPVVPPSFHISVLFEFKLLISSMSYVTVINVDTQSAVLSWNRRELIIKLVFCDGATRLCQRGPLGG